MISNGPEIRQWTKTDLEAEKEYAAEVERQMKGEMPKEILPQEAFMTEESKETLKLGINIPAYKRALKEQLISIEVGDRLSGESHRVALHWAVFDVLQNWLRAEFPGRQFSAWPWGNWWTIRLSYYDPLRAVRETTEIAMVIK